MSSNEATPPENLSLENAGPAADSSVIGRLTPEEQQGMMQIKSESQQLLAKVGEYELMKLRVMARLEELDERGQSMIGAVTKRLGLEDGQQWIGMQDGSIRLVQPPGAPQEEGAPPS